LSAYWCKNASNYNDGALKNYMGINRIEIDPVGGHFVMPNTAADKKLIKHLWYSKGL
jgi:hypothetical protein